MRYGSVCSGIEAASVAWHSLGWEAQWFSEIEHFPSEVLKYRFPNVPNLGDMTQLNQNPIFNEQPIDLLVGGTPCQSFSVAGLRKGLADPRGNLMLTFLSIADKRRPKWILWENVPGVLSSNGGKDFSTFLGALGELGYGFAYRVLDAQHFGVAQRRRRVFVVGHLGDWRVAAAVLFERESLQGNTKPSRKKREEVTANAEGSVRNPSTPRVSNALCARDYKGARPEADQGAPLIIDRATFSQGPNAQYEPRIEEGETMSTLVATGPHAVAQPIAYSFDALSSNSMKSSNPNSGCRTVDVAKTLDTATPEPSKNQGGIAIAQPISIDAECNARTNQFGTLVRGGEGGTQQFVAQPIAIAENTIGRQPMNGGNGDGFTEDGPMYTLNATGVHGVAQHLYYESHPQDSRVNGPKDVADTVSARYGTGGGNTPLVQQPIAVDTYNYTTNDHTTQTIRSQSDTEHIGAVLHSMAIRRLTPKECERLQGFPDDWTKIPYRNKEADQCPDGPRYKACGNSMAVPVMRWIGERIQKIENHLNP